jgi:hypothetical protein
VPRSLDPDDHGVGADEVLDASLPKACDAHPALAIPAGEVEAADVMHLEMRSAC